MTKIEELKLIIVCVLQEGFEVGRYWKGFLTFQLKNTERRMAQEETLFPELSNKFLHFLSISEIILKPFKVWLFLQLKLSF